MARTRLVSPVVQQLLTLAAVLLGAAASFTATTLTERGKWRRTYSTRWDEKRLTAYSTYATAVKACAQLSYRINAARGYPAGALPMDMTDGLNALAEAENERAVTWEAVLLLGSPAAVEAGRRWHETVWKLSWIARGKEASHDEFVDLYRMCGERRDEFYECARADLDVRSGRLPQPDRDWLPPADADLRP
jgi:hypothetical protein